MAPRLAECRGRIPLRVGLLSRLPVLSFRTLRLWPVWPGCIEATVRPADGLPLTVYGVHLAAYYPWFSEWWRAHQVRALLRHVRRTAPGDRHLLAGDFNALAPGDRASRYRPAPISPLADTPPSPRHSLRLLLPGKGLPDTNRVLSWPTRRREPRLLLRAP
jgi:endonuclease/exonuclease/phosphatase family metal-dependent hydrolase